MSQLRRTLVRLLPERRPAERAYDPAARQRAAAAILSHAEAHATLFERAERLRSRAERLEQEGTPSDSAANRAGRAEDEVRSTLSDLRSSFAASGGDLSVFDLELGQRYPAFEVSEIS